MTTRVSLADPRSAHLSLGQPVRTGFGSLTVAEAELGNGLSGEDLGGMSHGVSGLVGAGSAQVNVVVTLANTSTRAIGVAAAQFRLFAGAGATRPAGRSR